MKMYRIVPQTKRANTKIKLTQRTWAWMIAQAPKYV